MQWQRKCEDTLYSLLVLGARRPVRHLASVAMANIILKGDSISIYSRASSLQGFLSDGKRSEAQKVAGVYLCSFLYIMDICWSVGISNVSLRFFYVLTRLYTFLQF